MNLVFMGTPEFAVPCLKKIAEDPTIDIVGVVTQPDRPSGRGKKVRISPVKREAVELGLSIIQPEDINDRNVVDTVSGWNPDVIVVVAFGQILSASVLSIPPMGCINVHASLLPRYRGAAPVHWAIINGESKTGVTTMYMDEGMDTGDMILQRGVDIGPEETAGELHDRLAELGGRVLMETLHRIAEKTAPRLRQDHSNATYAPLLKRKDEAIDWADSAQNIVNRIRGMNPWPGAYTVLEGRSIKLWRAVACDCNEKDHVPEAELGTIVVASEEKGVIVASGSGQVRIIELQPENKPKMAADDFVRGRNIREGQVFLGDNP